MSTVKSAPKKVGTTGTEVIIGQAAGALKKVVGDITAAAALVSDALVEKAEHLSAQIANREAKIIDLDVEYTEKKRAADVTLDLAIQANADAKATEIITKQGKIAVASTEFEGLKNDLKSLKDKFDSEVKKAESAAFASKEKENKAALETQKLTFDATKAQMVAELSQKDNQISFLKEQIEFLKENIDSERTASVERAKASAVGTLNVNAGK